MAFPKLIVLLSFMVTASASPMVLHERRTDIPSGFLRQGAAPADAMLTLRVGLTANNVTGLEQKLTGIATPGSSDFRQWLSKDEVKAYTQPSPETLAAFSTFASANGLTPSPISPNGDWYSITLPVSKANTLFAAEFVLFTHPTLKEPITRTLSVSLPSELIGHVDVLHPSTSFVAHDVRLGLSVPDLAKGGVAASCNSSDPAGVVTPSCLQHLYGIPTAPATQKSSKLLVTGYIGQFAQEADLKKQFLTLTRPDIPPNTMFTLLTTDNGTNPQGATHAGIEANLDIQLAIGIATGVPTQFLSVGGPVTDFAGVLFDSITFLEGNDSLPTVMTTSYLDTESNFGASMATKICNGYMALGARGTSVIFASGDGGVHGVHDAPTACGDTFIPVFPASCPFVTTVGASQGFAPEKAANFTGGGFSNYFPTPTYQTDTIAGFVKTLQADFAGAFNETGRGYPDVSIQGWKIEIVNAGNVTLSGGTSSCAPSFAAIIALINDRLVAANKPVLGFLNPFLYSNASTAFTDITAGHNAGFECPASAVSLPA
ncbi:subtilisin-like protein [Mycena polygramma]|nr:subtilisin-like protein [Mycena polygramma]